MALQEGIQQGTVTLPPEYRIWCEIDSVTPRQVALRMGVGEDLIGDPVALQGPPLSVLKALESAAQRLRGLLGAQCCPGCDGSDHTVVIQVTGGGAYVARKPAGVAVSVEDFDAGRGQGEVRRYGDDVIVCDGESKPAFTDVSGVA